MEATARHGTAAQRSSTLTQVDHGCHGTAQHSTALTKVDHGSHGGIARHQQQEGVSHQLLTGQLAIGQVVPGHLQTAQWVGSGGKGRNGSEV